MRTTARRANRRRLGMQVVVQFEPPRHTECAYYVAGTLRVPSPRQKASKCTTMGMHSRLNAAALARYTCLFAGSYLCERLESAGCRDEPLPSPLREGSEIRSYITIMTMDRVCAVRRGLLRSRSVLTRAERITRLQEADRWKEDGSPLGLPKVRVFKLAMKKKKKKKEEEGAEELPPLLAPLRLPPPNPRPNRPARSNLAVAVGWALPTR